MATNASALERMDIVIVGHVDHGKSTVIGRLMADTGSLPDGKLEQVRRTCELNARPFEYAFLLDALKNEQAQGITIDTARCFFKTAGRHYVIHDAPGHVEFLKNMVTGAARAQAALLVLDIAEGVRENSMRHGYILSMLGIKQVAVLVNKMDLVGWDRGAFEALKREYEAFLGKVGVIDVHFIPVAARDGANIATRATESDWYAGPTVLEQVDLFHAGSGYADEPFRMPVQDVYKFTGGGDDRRIVAGTVETGTLEVGDEVVFLPSGKRSAVATLERFSGTAPRTAGPDEAIGFTMTDQVYARSGELVVKVGQPEPTVARRFRATLFWMGRAPMITGKRYQLKLGSARVPVELVEVVHALDASDFGTVRSKSQLDRHEVGEVVLEAAKPVAFDLIGSIERTARFVIVDEYDIAACGTVLDAIQVDRTLLAEHVREREHSWSGSGITAEARRARFGHAGKLIIVTGSEGAEPSTVARAIERDLFEQDRFTAFLGLGGQGTSALDPDGARDAVERAENLRHLGEVGRAMTGAGILLVTAVGSLDTFELSDLRVLSQPNELFLVCLGETEISTEAQVTGRADEPPATVAARVARGLIDSGIVPEYDI